MKFLVLAFALVASVSCEAEADADAYYAGFYGGYHAPYAYGKSAPCVNAANVPVPCALGRKRRDAEADPAVFYSGLGLAGYGLGYPYAYGAGLYGAGVVAGEALPHGIAYTGFGVGIHSSHVGVCTNY